jgi:hypothetical protein
MTTVTAPSVPRSVADEGARLLAFGATDADDADVRLVEGD